MERLAPLDTLCLMLESDEHPMHLAALQIFTPPEGSPTFVQDIYDAIRARPVVAPLFRKFPATTRRGKSSKRRWTFSEHVDINEHVRLTRLPAPGGLGELFDLASRLHTALLDLGKPLWEVHLIDGLHDGRFAVYTKAHHALVDGVAGIKLIHDALTTDPDDREVRVPWAVLPDNARRPSAEPNPQIRSAGPARSARSSISLLRSALREHRLIGPTQAPRTMLNVASRGARRCAGGSWSLQRIRSVADSAGTTVNDVALAMSSGALRAYLADRDALPGTPLIAMVPVNLRAEDVTEGGNISGAVLCDLATHLDDPARRLEAIHRCMRNSKEVITELPPWAVMAMGGLMMAPSITLPVVGRHLSPLFNIAITNVYGSRDPLYFCGARLDGNYPFTPALSEQALNVAMASTGDSLHFGIVGSDCSVPGMETLVDYLETSLKDLERAVLR